MEKLYRDKQNKQEVTAKKCNVAMVEMKENIEQMQSMIKDKDALIQKLLTELEENCQS